MEVPTPGPQNVNLIKTARYSVKMRPLGGPNTICLLSLQKGEIWNQRKTNTESRSYEDTQEEEGHVSREIHLEGLLESTRRQERRKDPPLQLLEETRPCQHLDFRFLASRSDNKSLL